MKRIITFCGIGALGLVAFGSAATALGQSQVNPNQQRQGSNASLGANGGYFYGVNQSPWFSNAAIRQQLQLNENQYNQLNKAYTQSWSRYNQGITGLDKSLAEQERLQQQRGFADSFNKEFGSAIDETFTDASAKQRYNQMDWQYRGYGAFNDPTIQQKLNLTAEQRQQFSNYQNEWGQQLSTWKSEYPNDREGVSSRFRDGRLGWQKRIDSTLTPDQRTMWRDMSGKPFDFPIDIYFQSNAPSNSSLKPGAK